MEIGHRAILISDFFFLPKFGVGPRNCTTANHERSNPALDVIACSNFSRKTFSFLYRGSYQYHFSPLYESETIEALTFSRFTHVLEVGSRC